MAEKHLKMAISMLVNLKMVKEMVKELTHIKMGRPGQVNGKIMNK